MRDLMRSGNEKEFSFAWSLLQDMGATGGAPTTLSAEPNTLWSMPPVHLTDKDRKTNALNILNVFCESPVLEPYLKSLLSTKYVTCLLCYPVTP